MKELTLLEIEAVSGAGWLQDGIASLGGKIGNFAWTTAGDLLSVDVPLIGNINLGQIAPTLGEKLGQSVGSTVGYTIESTLGSLPVIGGLFSKLLGN
ncbi:hypothetical protein MXF13_12275 [Leclercia adecarboxylata]|uniref:hypothetical protein n=1 Tax=Leclercia TaxID=83654 RepID=UPI000CD0E975|nr:MULTISPECIES: hypothetical protein [Leclercia]POV33145.1 hypothetical protein C3388_18255 [Leclercia sp. LSNIH5]POW64954.1 hypothetical protein C3389_16415 [Leclercia sp. LSNIH2]AUU83754.1 hypothetical protein C2U54_06880 [Leclercia sp. LSNIH1]MEB5750649.1 hypothetical protein [Leclercia adecarboxylata]QGW15420.1 hypothetical protein GNG29_02300 [Leclercia sp. Colony189]